MNIGMSIGMIGMSIGMIGMSVELEHRFEHLHETGAHESQFSSFRSMHEHLKNRLQMWLYPSCALRHLALEVLIYSDVFSTQWHCVACCM
jgi:hypothetical protein